MNAHTTFQTETPGLDRLIVLDARKDHRVSEAEYDADCADMIARLSSNARNDHERASIAHSVRQMHSAFRPMLVRK